MDQVSLKSNVMFACAIIDHVGPCLPCTLPKAAISNFTYIWKSPHCTDREVLRASEKEMKRPGHSWAEPGQTCISLLTLRPWLILLWTHFDAVHSKLCFLRLTLACANGSLSEKWMNTFMSTWTQHRTSETTLTIKPKNKQTKKNTQKNQTKKSNT